jgi:hypothetical protein
VGNQKTKNVCGYVKLMKVLHVASFTGNIGDNANHKGMRSRLEAVVGKTVEYTELEIRYCYRIYTGEHRWQFDDAFVEKANGHDLVIIGGGNFFEPWLDESANATTINITNERLEKITVPLVFFGVGFDIHKGVKQENLEKFSIFLEQCFKQSNVLISFRNDGSLKNLMIAYPEREDLWAGVEIVPDGGFFYSAEVDDASYLPEGIFWGLNIASDMEALRFPNLEGSITWVEFLAQLAGFLQHALESNPRLKIILFPHIFRDVLSIGQFMTYLDDRLCRDRLVVAPFACGVEACDHIFSLYKKCELVMGMRFHTNVCSIAMNVPAIPFVSYPKLYDLYEELGFEDRVVYANRNSFEKDIATKVLQVSSERMAICAANVLKAEELNGVINAFFGKVNKLIDGG